ncbi:unnamed protein product [Rotaria sordida]|uniref:Protein kinase domain-containing protein n=3 Tax=Rotaria sordida TaxID=392033 RepID=A0A813QSG7_9BILA|nr:unnamed protein product [Rotaria sordida]CAF0771239.1 unnamed protein product [Rotaria sordida]CAF1279359.1 unnamed protein product [Rotaria sordida]CAF3473074.1 unnamed protein product [Rotaria sordida]CAF3713225.1 unnamed protein product [Rotaria sordida]
MSQRYILTSNISQTDISNDVHEMDVIEESVGSYRNDLLSGSYPIKVMAYKVDTPLSLSATTSVNKSLNYTVELHIGEREKIGQGTFGKVYKAKLITTQEIVAIKEVEIEEKFKSRELDILKTMIHPNIVRLKYFFHSSSIKDTLCLIMEYMPMSAHRLISNYRHNHKILPLFYIKLFCYQMLRGLGYLHVQGVAHRDVKPANMIVDYEAGILKICDLGSAKKLNKNEKSVSYVCTRYYRAPELLLGCTEYTTAVDIWSAGCCIAEFLNGYAIFRGIDSSDQMYRIIKIIGIPTRDELREMNSRYTGSVDLTVITFTPRTLRGYLPERTQESALILLEQLLKYKPNERLTCQAALASDFFSELKQHSILLPNKRHLPPLFNFRENELLKTSHLYSTIVPDFIRNNLTDMHDIENHKLTLK